jgi:phage terminase large subunit-like protein
LRNIDRNIPYGSVVATRGKAVRAEPIAALYTQGKVSHVSGLEKLESQMTEMTTAGFQGSGSPDRVDALVWAVSSLMTSSSIPIRENSFISLK